MNHFNAVAFVALFAGSPALAHDTWVETNTNLIRTGDAVYVDLCLGNHGNDHRDFKLASKADAAASTLEIVAPDGRKYDLKDRLVDVGYAPKEGYWVAKFATADAGLYVVSHTLDKIVNHGKPTRSIKGGKTFFMASPTLDRVEAQGEAFAKPLGHALEIVPATNPVYPLGPGMPLKVTVLFKGQPLPGARISFVPRGETLSEGFDEVYERKTDAAGKAEFTPKTGNQYLVVVHHLSPDEAGQGYEETAYSATLTVFVPEVCPCCAE